MRKVILLLALLTVSNVLLYSQKEDIIPIEVIEIKKSNTKGNHVPAKIQKEIDTGFIYMLIMPRYE